MECKEGGRGSRCIASDESSDEDPWILLFSESHLACFAGVRFLTHTHTEVHWDKQRWWVGSCCCVSWGKFVTNVLTVQPHSVFNTCAHTQKASRTHFTSVINAPLNMFTVRVISTNGKMRRDDEKSFSPSSPSSPLKRHLSSPLSVPAAILCDGCNKGTVCKVAPQNVKRINSGTCN